MSSVPEGWYVDPSTGTNLRWWDGTTWTDEVAPLPYEKTTSGPVDLFDAVADAQVVTDGVLAGEPINEASADSLERDEPAIAVLDADIELTRLTRRELRARRDDAVVDDAPKHLPPVTPVAAVAVVQVLEAEEDGEIPALPAQEVEDSEAEDTKPDRRRRIVRLSVLLGILAVATSVAVVTTGAL